MASHMEAVTHKKLKSSGKKFLNREGGIDQGWFSFLGVIVISHR